MLSRNSSVIFIGNDYQEKYFESYKSKFGLLRVPIRSMPERILVSFMPPVFGKKSQKVYVDFLGPLIALILLLIVLNYGHSTKLTQASLKISPLEVLIVYVIVMPCITYMICKCGGANLSFKRVAALIGYSMFGHVLTLTFSSLFHREATNIFMYSLIFFEGLSTFRVTVVLLKCMSVPAARLLVCSTVSILQLLFVIFLHFGYMHRTFMYSTE